MIIRNPDPDGFSFCPQSFWDSLRSRQDESIWTREEMFHHSVGIIGNAGIFGNIPQIGANKAEEFSISIIFNMKYSFKSNFIKNIASNTIDSIGGINNNAPLFYYFDGFAYKSLLGIQRVKLIKFHKAPFFI